MAVAADPLKAEQVEDARTAGASKVSNKDQDVNPTAASGKGDANGMEETSEGEESSPDAANTPNPRRFQRRGL